MPVISARPRARAQAAMARGRRIDLCDLSSRKLLSVHNLQAQPPAPDYSQPTNQPAPSVLLRLQPATDCFICKMTSIKLTTKLKFPCITNETDVQVFSVGSWNSNRNNHKLPWQGVLHLQYLQNKRDTDSLILVPKGPLANMYLFWNNCIESQHFWHTR